MTVHAQSDNPTERQSESGRYRLELVSDERDTRRGQHIDIEA